MRSYSMSETLPRLLVELVLVLHLLQLGCLIWVILTRQRGESEARSDIHFVLLVAMATISIVCGDSIVVLTAYNRRRAAERVSAETWAAKPAPRLERFVHVAPAGAQSDADDVEAPADEASCAICLGGFSSGELLSRLPCNHTFHAECVDRWFASHASTAAWCPYRCRCDPFPEVLPQESRWASNDVTVTEM